MDQEWVFCGREQKVLGNSAFLPSVLDQLIKYIILGNFKINFSLSISVVSISLILILEENLLEGKKDNKMPAFSF